MFDTYLLPRPSAPSVHVHNEVKPHDPADAARLYGELKDRAEVAVANATIERFGAENEIVVVKVEHHTNYMTEQTKVRILFKLNGHTFDFVCEPDMDKIKDRFYNTAADLLAHEITAHFARTRLSPPTKPEP